MLTFLGILIFISALIMLIGRFFTHRPEPIDDGRYRETPFFYRIEKKYVFIALAVGFLLSFTTTMFFYAKPGTAYAIQYLWGGDKAVFTQGIKVKLGGRTIPIQYEIPVQDLILKNDENDLPKDDEIYYRRAENWEFADAIKAKIGTAVIVGIDTGNEEAFLNMADRNKSEDKLVSARVMPAIDGALRLTCKLMDAQDYISGEAASFDMYFRDQLEHGTYILEEYYDKEEEPEIIGDSATVRVIKPVNTTKTKKYRILEKGGIKQRDTSNSLKRYGLSVLQAQITDIDWEESFDKRLDLQKNEVAQTQLEKQQAEREFYRAQREKAKGEADKAQERAKLEKEQIQKTIEAETEAKVAAFNKEKERIQVEVVELQARAKKIAADAVFYENSKRVQAGLTPQERAEYDLKTADVVSRNLAGPNGLKLPNTVMGNTGSNGGNLLESLIGAELAKNMMKN